MSGAFVIASKDLRLLARDKAALFWVLGFPILLAVLFGSVFGGAGGNGASKMKVAVLDDDRTAVSKSFLDHLRKSTAVEISTPAEEAAKEGVRKGDLVAYVRVPKGFGDSNMFAPQAGPELEVGIDPSRHAEAGYLQGVLTEATFASLATQFSDPALVHTQMERNRQQIASASGMDAGQKKALGSLFTDAERFYGSGGNSGSFSPAGGAKIKMNPVSRDRRGPHSSFEISFPQAIVWALFGAVTTFSLSIVRERTAGTMQRLTISPLSRGEIMAGKGLACFVACTSVTVLLLAIGAAFFHVRFQNVTALALAILCTAFCFVGIMMLLSVLGRSEQAVSGSGSAVMIILNMFGGGMLPLIAMPEWMLHLSSISPVKWAVLSLEGAIWRGFSLTEMASPCIVLLAVGTACFAAGVLRLAKMDA